MKHIKWKESTAVIVCHDSVPGPPHSLRDFLLRKKIKKLYFIGHVNQFVKENRIKSSYLKIYTNGLYSTTITAKSINLPEPLMYVHDSILTLVWCLKYVREHIQFFVGLGNLNAIVGVLLQIIGKVTTSIYYVIDYIPQRFENKVMNTFYHYLDNICASHASTTWNYGEGMIKARTTFWNKKFPHQLLIPHGVDRICSSNVYDHHKLIYMGSLLEQQGLQILVEALPVIKKSIPSIRLEIIGSGPYLNTLKQLVSEIKLERVVQFLGFIEKPEDVDVQISQSVLGIALYKPDSGFVTYTEPSKVKRYLSCGVPVILTEGIPLSEEIKKYNCGIVTRYNSNEIAKRIIEFIKNKRKRDESRVNAQSFVMKYSWNEIFTRAFNSSL